MKADSCLCHVIAVRNGIIYRAHMVGLYETDIQSVHFHIEFRWHGAPAGRSSRPCLTFSAEIGSANKSPSLRYLPFENLVTDISILTPLEFVFAFFGQQAEVHRTGKSPLQWK